MSSHTSSVKMAMLPHPEDSFPNDKFRERQHLIQRPAIGQQRLKASILILLKFKDKHSLRPVP